jgi:hypothetical protein
MATLYLGGVKQVDVQFDSAGGFVEIPAVLSVDLSTDSNTQAMSDGTDINAGYKASITIETLDILTATGAGTGTGATWYQKVKQMLDNPFSDDGSTNNYQVKLTMKDDGTATFDGIRVAGLDFVAGADGEYSRWVVSFNATGVDVLDVLTLST